MGIKFNKNCPYTLSMAISLSLQKALLMEITPKLRLVGVDWNNQTNIITIFFYFDGNITDEDQVSACRVGAKCSADFGKNVKLLEKCIQLDFPKKIPAHMKEVYWRKE